MKDDNNLEISKSVFIVPVFYVVLIWFIYWVEIFFSYNFNKFGVYPRTFEGLRGIIFTHFIHSDTNHLFNNSIPLFVLLSSLFYFYRDLALKILVFGGLLTGLLTWAIARPSFHIGASGIVYLLFSFVFFSGIIRKHYRLVALSLIIIFLYGSMIWYVLPIKEGMSWEGHLSGFVVGFMFSILFRKKGITKKPFQFSKTDFDLLFDEDGNLIDSSIQETIETNVDDANNIN
jgi:membrane associated rhomboid family serine protease